MIKTSNQILTSDEQISMQKKKKYEKQDNVPPPNINNPTTKHLNDSEVNEISNI
jgi:hypothetical protein